MKTLTKRATVYFEPHLHRALRLKAIERETTFSNLVNEAIQHELKEDAIDLAAFHQRKNESNISFEKVLKKLKANGKL
ncbi:MAG: CopG family transcriptional regulator [Verrucomicrobiae bacterium]|nr:CopG family transcriptional regulator [Verrucomicrobiae bacterium]